jgi:anaphase-promoting complex subunit 6
MCFLRGIVFKNLHNFVVAKQCFKEALKIDVTCYDALDIMISNNMLTTSEGKTLCMPEQIPGLVTRQELWNQMKHDLTRTFYNL